MIAAVERQAPPKTGLVRPKLRYAHQGGINPPRIIIHGNALDRVPDSYKALPRGIPSAIRSSLPERQCRTSSAPAGTRTRRKKRRALGPARTRRRPGGFRKSRTDDSATAAISSAQVRPRIFMRPRTFSPGENNDPQGQCSQREGKM